MYKRLKSKLLAAALTLALIPSAFTCTALAAEVTDPPLVKATGYQDFPAYYEDIHHLPNQVTHPDVVVRDAAWNGYRYWAIYTPNVTRTSIYENPSIVASNDGVHWEAPVGLTNPIDPQPSSTRYHNCDADMIYNPEMDAMMGYWNWADDQAGGVGAEVRLRISYDGVHWGIPVTYDAQTRTWTKPTTEEERQVVSGPTDFIPAVTSSARYDMLSPTFVYDSFRDIFMMWSNNTGDVGYNNGQSNFVELRYSNDGITWGAPTRVNNFLGTNESGQQLAPWHQDVQYVPELKEFLCISQCFSGGNPDGSVLHFTKSKDGLNWEPVGNKPLLSPGEDGSWDDFQIYRSSFYYEPGEEVGNGTIRVWYSALQKNTNNILVADSSGNKTLQAKDQDDRIWRIGYASNSYTAMMKSLMNDSEYTVPALIPGTSMTLTRDNANAKVYAGDMTTVQASFLPEDTSDQLVKFSSSDPSVATVNQHGVVTTISAGTVNIIGETREGLTATLELAVEPNVFSLIPQSTMTASATSEHASTSEGPASYVLDGNSSTIWHTAYNPKVDLPQTLTVSFNQTRTVGRYVYTPRQVGTNGIVTQYELYAVQDGGEAVLIASGSWAEDHTDKVVTFDPVDATAIQLKVIAGAGGFGTAAEINVYEYANETPELTYHIVDDRDASLVYSGTWHDDSASTFLDGTARYTSDTNASVSFTFTGTAIQWYGQNDTNFGTAKVYIDGILAETVNVNGTMTSQKLLFSRTGLSAGEHTILVVRASETIDVDYFAYAN